MTEEEEIKFLNFIFAILQRYVIDGALFPEMGGKGGEYYVIHKDAVKSITSDIVERIIRESNERGFNEDCAH